MNLSKRGIGALKGVSQLRLIRRYVKSAKEEESIYLNPHEWKGLPADRIFELHNMRKDTLGQNYNPSNEEREAILSTFKSLGITKPGLEYVYEIDNFKERHMNNTPANMRGLPPRRSNVRVVEKGETPHQQRKKEQLRQISAYEMPLLAKFRQEYRPQASLETPLKLTFTTDFSDESNATTRKVRINCHIKDLNLREQEEKKLKILAGNRFDHHTNTVHFATGQYPEATQNARSLVDTFNKLLAEAKDLTDDFSDIPVDTRHMKPKKQIVTYPEEWKRPQDAPISRHKIIEELVDKVKHKHDSKHISKFTP